MSTGPEPRDDDRARKIGGEIVRRLKSYAEELQMPSEGMLRVPAGTPLSEILEVVNMGIGIEQVRAGTKQEDGSEDLYQVVFNLVIFRKHLAVRLFPIGSRKACSKRLEERAFGRGVAANSTGIWKRRIARATTFLEFQRFTAIERISPL